ncbi:SDR family NAD(P)-dependent oxidoreductase [Micromonospora sp. NPDC049051]|uniref:type I polyketide synthase n=1 Tax=Micromonospora sp. NPDC049051 TaxID=3364264 RepID=UPI00371A4567
MEDELAVAVVGMALRCPGAETPEEFWQNLVDGVESIERFAPEEVELPARLRDLDSGAVHVPAGGLLDEPARFDAEFFRMSPREAQLIDPQHRLLLEVAHEAFENAGVVPGAGTTAVYAGAGFPSYLWSRLLDSPTTEGAGQYWLTVGNDKDHVATRIAYTLNLQGPVATVQSACSTSLVCVHFACQSLLAGECDVALAGAASVGFPQRRGYHYTEGGILSPDGHCRPFDAQAQGAVPGSGVGAVVLKRLADARRDGDPIRMVILGSAIGNDGAARMSYAAPAVAGQAAVISGALRVAGVKPDEVSYVEAHGTGTPLGDPIEVAALARAMPGEPGSAPPCWLGSVKANIGHLDVAAGMAGLVKTALALEHETIPPTLHFTEPNPRLELDRTRFQVAGRAVPWPRTGPVRVAGISSFGLGGTNGHLVVTEPPRDRGGEEPVRAVAPPTQPVALPLSADSPAALDRLADRLAPALGPDLPAAARTLAARRPRGVRRVLLATDPAHAAELLHSQRQSQHAGPGRVAFVFSGAGKHAVAEAAELLAFDAFAEAYGQARAVFADLGSTLLEPDVTDPELLRRPTLSLPSLFAVQVALARLWMARGVRPTAVAGHSAGECAAAHIAGSLPLEDAAALVVMRARLLEESAPGRMAVVPLPAAEAERLGATFGLTLAAVNTAHSCVLAGEVAAYQRFAEHAEATGLDIQPVGIATVPHSPLLADGARQLTAFAEGLDLRPPTIAYVSALTGARVDAAELARPGYWGEHLCRPVRFADAVAALTAEADLFVEIGPAGTVEPLVAADPQVERETVVGSLPHPKEGVRPQRRLIESLGRLWAQGAEVDWSTVLGAGPRAAVPTAPFVGVTHLARAGTDAAVDAPRAPAATGAGPRVFAPTWHRVVRPPAAVPTGNWLVLGADSPLAGELVARITAAGGGARRVDAPVADFPAGTSGLAETFDRVVAEFEALLDDPELVGVLDLTGHDASPTAAGQPVDASAFHRRLALIRAVDHRPESPLRLVCVVSGTCAVLGDEPADPAAALAYGPVLVADREYPHLSTRIVDVDRAGDPAVTAAVLTGELGDDEGPELYAVRGRHRWQRSFSPVPAPQPPSEGTDLGPVLVTGGLGGIGRSVAVELARTGTTAIALVGRAAAPPRSQWEALLAADPGSPVAALVRDLRAIEASGARLLTVAADCTDPAAMRAAVDRIATELGPVSTLVHAAGVPGGGLIRLRSVDECATVLAPKVRGVRVLADVLADQPLRRVLLCSALDAVLGTVGQVDHVAANAFLDAVPGAGWFGDAVVTSVGWGAWQEVGQAADVSKVGGLANWRNRALADALTPQEGARLAHALAFGAGGTMVAGTVDPELLLEQARQADVVSLFEDEQPDGTRQLLPRPALSVPYREPEGPIAVAVAGIWSEVLGISPIGMDDNYFALGGHSLAAVALVARLRRIFAFPIGLTDTIARPTVAAQVQWLEAELDRFLDSISDEEVERQLAALEAGGQEIRPDGSPG